MYIDDKLYTNFQNLTTTTIHSHVTSPLDTFENIDDMTRTLTYAIPVSCLAIVIVLLLAVGMHRRQDLLEKWASLKQMKNTNPRFYERSGLRRDSEYESNESHCDSYISVVSLNQDTQVQNEPDQSLATCIL